MLHFFQNIATALLGTDIESITIDCFIMKSSTGNIELGIIGKTILLTIVWIKRPKITV